MVRGERIKGRAPGKEETHHEPGVGVYSKRTESQFGHTPLFSSLWSYITAAEEHVDKD